MPTISIRELYMHGARWMEGKLGEIVQWAVVQSETEDSLGSSEA